MRKSILVLPAVAAVLTFGATAAAQAAPAAPHPNAVVGVLEDLNGTAGYYTQSFGTLFERVDGTVKLNLPSIPFEDNGALGIQLCNATTGHVAQVGLQADGLGNWIVVADIGTFSTNTLSSNPSDVCDGNFFFNKSIHVFVGSIYHLGIINKAEAAGAVVRMRITEVDHHVVFTVADSLANNYNYSVYTFEKRHYYNEAGAGMEGDISLISAPAINDIADFSGVTATAEGPDVTDGFGAWNAVEVVSGFPGYAPLIAPSALTPPTGTVRVTHPGHWKKWTTGKGKHKHHHKRWIPAYTTCGGGGPSSFSIIAGSPIGV